MRKPLLLPVVAAVSHAEVSMRVLSSLAVVLVCLLLLPPPSSGQVSLGFHGGLSLATMGGDDASDETDYRTGIGFGASLAIPVSDVVSIQPEVLYLQKGAEWNWDGAEVTLEADYVEVPLFLRIDVPTEGIVAPYFMFGPAIGFKAGCQYTGEGGVVSFEMGCDEAGIDIKSIDLGGVVAAGLGIETGPGEIMLGARYNLGLTTIDDSAHEWDLKSRAFTFLAGYSFPLGGQREVPPETRPGSV